MLLAALIFAQTATPPLVVTASRLPPLTSGIVADDSTIAASDSVASVLGGMPQLFVMQPGGRSGFASATVDGADPNFALVLFDGVPINNATSSRGGAVNMAEIGTFGLGRVELLPSSLSAVHGSGALAGVVAITPRAPADRLEVTAQAGGITRGGHTMAAGVSGPLGGRWGVSFTGQVDDDGTASPLSRFVARTALLRLVRHDGGDRFLLRVNDIDAAGFPDGSGGALLAQRRAAEQRRAREWLAAVRTRKQLGDALLLDLNASWLRRDDSINSPGVVGSASNPAGLPASTDATRYDRLLGQASLQWTAGSTQFAVGIEGSDERGRADGSLAFGPFRLPTAYRLDRAAYAGFAELSGRAGGLSANAAMRVDQVGSLRARLSGRVAAAADLGNGWRIDASAGSSFKAPSFYALGNPLVGNPALRPETGRRADIAIGWQQGDTRLRLGGFVSRYRDLIDFIFQPRPALVNRGEVAIHGVSASASRAWGQLQVDVAVQHLWPRDTTGGPALLLRPRWRANAALRWKANDQLSLGLRAGQVGARDDESVPGGRQRLAPYTALAADAHFDVTQRLTLRFAADNLFDGDWQEAAGFPTAPLRLRLLATARF